MSKFDEITGEKIMDKKEDKKEPKKVEIHPHHYKEIKIRFKPIFIERILYYIIILVLVVLLAMSHFGGGECEGGKDVVQQNVQADDSDDSTDSSDNSTADDSSDQADDSDDSTDSSDDSTTDDSSDGNERVVDADLIFRASDITTEGTTNARVTEIKYKIDNKGTVLRARIDVLWYDSEDSDLMKSKIRTSAYTIIPAEQVIEKTITSFKSSYFNSANDEETVLLRLYDNSDDTLLDTKKIVVTPS